MSGWLNRGLRKKQRVWGQKVGSPLVITEGNQLFQAQTVKRNNLACGSNDTVGFLIHGIFDAWNS